MATFYIYYLWSLTLENTIPNPRTWEMEIRETKSPRLHRKSSPTTLHLTEKVFQVIHLSTQWTKMHTSVCWQYINPFKSKPIILSINQSSATTFFSHAGWFSFLCFLKCRLLKLHIHNEFGEMWKGSYIFWLFCGFSQGFWGRKEKHLSVTMISNAEVASVALRKSHRMWRGDAQPNGHKARRAKGSPYFSGETLTHSLH